MLSKIRYPMSAFQEGEPLFSLPEKAQREIIELIKNASHYTSEQA
ncbi:hypothetical protein AWB71_04544 [Caballeronia peredens]|nr:hypothetical protein AWB71_04544 [Caballeronia peredens]